MAVKKRKGHLPPFIPLIRGTIRTPAWKALSMGARCVYIVLKDFLRIDNTNNGKVYRSYRNIRADLGMGTLWSIGVWLRELEHYGFIVQTSGAYLGVDGDGISAHWRLTECPSFDAKGNMIAATRDFDKWDGTLFVRPRKTESRGTRGDRVSSLVLHTGEAETVKIVPDCGTRGDIDSPPDCGTRGDISSCHSPSPSKLFWATPALTEIPFDSLPVELRMLERQSSQEIN